MRFSLRAKQIEDENPLVWKAKRDDVLCLHCLRDNLPRSQCFPIGWHGDFAS